VKQKNYHSERRKRKLLPYLRGRNHTFLKLEIPLLLQGMGRSRRDLSVRARGDQGEGVGWRRSPERIASLMVFPFIKGVARLTEKEKIA